MTARFSTVEEYLDSFPHPIADRLRIVRRIAREVVPGAGERISYGIPALTLDGRDIVFYSGWKGHVALYPVPSGDAALDRDLDGYRAGRGTLQFRHDRPLPEDLVRRVVTALTADRGPTAGPRRSRGHDRKDNAQPPGAGLDPKKNEAR